MKTLQLIVVAGLMVTGAAHANQKLAEANACLACHAVDKKLVGPGFQEVAKKYAGQKDALETVTANIKKGGVNRWGPIPMPAQDTLSDADAKALASWILGGAK